MVSLIQHYWPHALTIFLGGTIGVASKMGFFEGVGGWLWGWIKLNWPFRMKGKFRKKVAHPMIQIARLEQKIKNINLNFSGIKKEFRAAKVLLNKCESERTECRVDMRNLVMRVSALERKRV